MSLFRTVYRIVQRYGPLTDLEGDGELIPLTRGTISPSYHSPPSAKEILRFIAQPFRVEQGDIVKICYFPPIASDSCADRASRLGFPTSFSIVGMVQVWCKESMGFSSEFLVICSKKVSCLWCMRMFFCVGVSFAVFRDSTSSCSSAQCSTTLCTHNHQG